MKVAYLIMAHSHPDRLKKLVEALEAPWADIFIHIDKREPLAPYKECLKGKNVFFIESRIKVNWAGWSQVRAQLILLQTACSPRYKYYKLLSSSCYPIKSKSYIYDFLVKHNESFVRYWALPGKDMVIRNNERSVRYYFFIDAINIENFLRPERFRAHPVKYLLRHPFSIIYWCFFYLVTDKRLVLRKLIPARKPPPGLDTYAGDTWWCLKHSFVVYLLNFINKNPRVIRFFKYIKNPDEFLIPSLLVLSKLPYTRLQIHINMMSNPINSEKITNLLNKSHVLFIRKINDNSFALLNRHRNKD